MTEAPPIMLVSDLDGTMIGDDEATARVSDFWVARHEAAVSFTSMAEPRMLDLTLLLIDKLVWCTVRVPCSFIAQVDR